MNEKDLIRQLKAMREIKPRKDWVSLTKYQILGQEEKSSSFSFPVFNWKWAFAPAMAVLLIVGFLAFNSFFPAKEIEVAKEPLPTEEPEIAQLPEKTVKSMDPKTTKELTDMLKKTEELTLTLDYLSETVKNHPELAEVVIKDIEKVEEEIAYIGQTITQLGKIEESVEAAEQVKSDIEQKIEELISFFETRTLAEKEQEALEAAKAAYEAGEFEEALGKLLEI